MRLVRRVRGDVVEHRIKRGCQGLKLYNAGKHRAIANFRVDDKRRALGHLERMKFRRRCANALFNLGRSRALEQLLVVYFAGTRSNLCGNFPIAHLFPLAQRGFRQCEANAIIDKTKVPGGFGYAIRCEPFRQTGDRTNRC